MYLCKCELNIRDLHIYVNLNTIREYAVTNHYQPIDVELAD